LTHRSFKDRKGLHWDVWEVKPTASERRYLQRRVHEDDRTDSAERRSGDERRRSRISRTPAASDLARGWLCFECSTEKRRLAPVPDAWERVDDDTMEQWCCTAKPVVPRTSDPKFGAGGAEKIS